MAMVVANAHAARAKGTIGNSRVHSVFSDRMYRSMTARLPYFPIAPNRCWRLRRRHHAMNASAVN